MRASAANSGNDHRLGANEAPPAIISIFMGDELTEILDCISEGKAAKVKGQSFMKLGVDTLPDLPKDNTDRNRTSPFAFTGNKFEFRMPPSSGSISNPNMVLNTIVAETLDEFATRLEKAKDINAEATAIVKEVVNQHGRVIFNGAARVYHYSSLANSFVVPGDKNGELRFCNIDCMCFMTRMELAKKYIKYWDDTFAADWLFISTLSKNGVKTKFIDKIIGEKF